MAWMRPSAAASCSGSAARAGPYSGSRSSLRAMVSPATKSITNAEPRPSAASAHQRTRGTGTLAAAATSRSANSPARLDSMTCPGGSRRRTRGSRRPSGCNAVKSQISREAPPGSLLRPSTVTSAPSRTWTLAASRSARSVDVIEELRPAVAHAAGPVPFGEPLGDARGDPVAAVAERDHRQHASGHLLGRAAVGRMQSRPQPPVQLLRPGVIARDLDSPDRTIRLSIGVEIAALDLRAVALHGERRGDAGAGAEVHGEPAIVPRRLPVARPPGPVAQPEAVDRPGPVADRDAAGRASVRLAMTPRELLPAALRSHAHPASVALLAQLPAVGRRERVVVERDACRHVRVLREGRPRIEEVEGALEQARRALVADRVLAHRRTHLEAHAAGVEGRVARDPRPTEHESDRAVRQVETERHLGIALVGPVADPYEPAQSLGGVVEVVVGALVVVLLAGVLVHEVVGVEADPADSAHVGTRVSHAVCRTHQRSCDAPRGPAYPEGHRAR